MSADRNTAAVITVGDELLAGDHPDLNTPAIAQALAGVGLRLERACVLGDDEAELARLVSEYAASHAVVFVTGGLGPTLDDVTRHALARAAGVALVLSEPALVDLRRWFERSGRTMAKANERQALLPEGGQLLCNRRGTAPGIELLLGGARVFALPGPPAEMQDMLAKEVLPRLKPASGGEYHVQTRMHLFDLSESLFADRVGEWMEREANPLIGVTAKAGVLSVRLVARSTRLEQAEQLLASRVDEMRGLFQEHLLSETAADPAHALGQFLIEHGITLALAESCTGGLVASRLTNVPGISAVFGRGWVTYSNEAKQCELGVSAERLAEHGAVSAEVVEAMALGAAERAECRAALAVSGVAGPGGGTPEKPVGLVWYGLALDGRVTSFSRRWPDAGRERVREWATNFALGSLLRHLKSS